MLSPCPSPELVKKEYEKGLKLIISLDPSCNEFRSTASELGVAIIDFVLQSLSTRPVEEINELAFIGRAILRAEGRVLVQGSQESDDRSCFLANALAVAWGLDSTFTCPLSPVQELALSWYARLLQLLDTEKIHKLFELGKLYDFGSGLEHASTVAHISLDIATALTEGNGFTKRELATLYAAAFLHDIGRYFSERGHEEVSAHIVGSHASKLEEDFDIPLLLFCIRHHRRHTEPRKDPEMEKLGEKSLRLAAILRLADAFTNVYDKEEYWGARGSGEGVMIVARFVNKQRFESKAKLLEEIGIKVELSSPS